MLICCDMLWISFMGFGVVVLVGLLCFWVFVLDDLFLFVVLFVIYFLVCVKYVIFCFMFGGVLYVDFFDFKLKLCELYGQLMLVKVECMQFNNNGNIMVSLFMFLL